MLENIPCDADIISLGVFSAHCLFTLGFLIGMVWKKLFGKQLGLVDINPPEPPPELPVLSLE